MSETQLETRGTEATKAAMQRRQARKLRAHRAGWFFSQMHNAVDNPPALEPVAKLPTEKQGELL